MKKVLSIALLFAASLCIIPNTNAQTLEDRRVNLPIQENSKYALLVDQTNYFMGAVSTGLQFKEQHKQLEYEVVLIGSAVKELATNQDLILLIEQAARQQIRIVVCEMAMKKQGLDVSDFHDSILFTPNGFQYLWGLQDNGFKTIAL